MKRRNVVGGFPGGGMRAACVLAILVAAVRGASGQEGADYRRALDKLSGVHPRVFVPPGKLAEFRERFRKDFPDLVRSFGRLDKSIGEPLMPEPPATRTKVEFVETMDRIRRFCGRMESFGQSYLVTGKEAHGREAARLLLHIASWGPDAGGGFKACDEVPMSVMQTGPPVYDWIYPMLSEDERSRIRSAFQARGRAMFSRVGEGRAVPQDSHGGRMLGFMGVGGIAFLGEIPEARRWLEAMVELVGGPQYPNWGGADGGWSEGPQYWSWYMGYMIPFLAAFRAATGSDRLHNKPFFRNTIYYGLYCSPLNLPVAPFGDAAESNAAWQKAVVARCFGHAYGNGHFIWYSFQTRSSPAFAEAAAVCAAGAGRPGVAPKPPDDIEQSRHFRDIGWVAMHSALARPEEDVFLLWKCSPYGGRSHSHADQNAFVLSAFGRPLAIASGYYDYYGSPHHYGWTRQTKANNCVLVDGAGQDERRGEGRVECYLSDSASGWGGGFTYARGDATGVYAGRLARAIRHVAKLEGDLFVVADDLEAPSPARYSWLLHAQERMALDAGAAEIVSAGGGARLAARVLVPRGVDLSQSSLFDPPPLRDQAIATRGRPQRPDQFHASASTREKYKEGAFLVRLAVSRGEPPAMMKGERAEESAHGAAAAWEDGRGKWVVIMRRRGAAGREVSFEGACLAGEFAAVRVEGGRVARFLVSDASRLTWNGEEIFAAGSPSSASAGRDASGTWRVGLSEGKRGTAVRVRAAAAASVGRFYPERSTEAREIRVSSSRGLVSFGHPGEGGTLALGGR